MDKLALKGLRVDCIVGVYPNERHSPQPVELDLVLSLDTRQAAHGGHIKDTVDYARLAGELRFILQASRFLLLESAAEALARYVLLPPAEDTARPPVQEVVVKLQKPLALAGAGIPSLEIQRSAGEYKFVTEHKFFGDVDVIFETKGCGIYRERIGPGKTLPAHVHKQMDESELVLGSGLLLQGRPVAAGTARNWPRGFAHRYDNPTATEQSFVCIDRPAFIPEDETFVDVPLAQLADVEATTFFRSHA